MQKPNPYKKPLNDVYLWQNLIAGKEWSLAKLFDMYYEQLYFFCLGFLKEEDEAKDLVQDLFIKIWTNRSQQKKILHVKAYLFKMLRSMIADYYRSRKKEYDLKKNTLEPPFELSHEEVLISLESNDEIKEKIKKAIKNLSSREREIFYLRFIAQVEYVKIAEIMKIKYQSLRNLAHSALQKVRAGIS